jgi:hypothetical protein
LYQVIIKLLRVIGSKAFQQIKHLAGTAQVEVQGDTIRYGAQKLNPGLKNADGLKTQFLHFFLQIGRQPFIAGDDDFTFGVENLHNILRIYKLNTAVFVS